MKTSLKGYVLDREDKYTIACGKCKKYEDTFTKNEKPEDFDWIFHRNKWFCPICSKFEMK